MSLGETIYRLRTKQNMSQGDLAEALEVSRQSISKWETDSSVPELDKLIKMSGIFGVTMDELILGKQPEPDTATNAIPQVQTVIRSDGPSRKTVALVLLSLGVLVWLILTVMGGFLVGLLFASPFLLCGVVCLIFKRNTGLWCAWALFFAVNVYLRYATGITWRLTLWTLNYDPSMNYMRLAIAWAELLCFVVMLTVTVLRFRKKQLLMTMRNLCLLIAGWMVFALTFIRIPFDPLSAMGNIYYYFADWVRIILLTTLLTCTFRIYQTRKNAIQ